MPAIFLEYPVFTVVALDEDGKILVGGGGGSSKTGVPNSMVNSVFQVPHGFRGPKNL